MYKILGAWADPRGRVGDLTWCICIGDGFWYTPFHFLSYFGVILFVSLSLCSDLGCTVSDRLPSFSETEAIATAFQK